MYMKHLDITIDLETCSLSSHAAILQIAAVAWDRFAIDADHIFLGTATKPDETPHFCEAIDINSQFVEGLWDFSQSTAEWWRKQTTEAKKAVLGDTSGMPLDTALRCLDAWVNKIMEQWDCKSVTFWTQGTDFDIPILRYSAERCGLDRTCKPIATHHKYYRDCRTAIYELTSIYLQHIMPSDDDTHNDFLTDPLMAYRVLPELPESFGGKDNAHGALYDAVRSSWFTWQAMRHVRDLSTDKQKK